LIAIVAIAAGLARSTAVQIPPVIGSSLTSSIVELVGVPLRPRRRHVEQARAPGGRERFSA